MQSDGPAVAAPIRGRRRPRAVEGRHGPRDSAGLFSRFGRDAPAPALRAAILARWANTCSPTTSGRLCQQRICRHSTSLHPSQEIVAPNILGLGARGHCQDASPREGTTDVKGPVHGPCQQREDPCRPNGTTFHSNWPSRLPLVCGQHPQLVIRCWPDQAW